MTGLDKILDEIKRKGQLRANEINQEAQEKSSDILKKGKENLKGKKDAFIREMTKLKKLELQKGKTGAATQKNKEILKSKQELIAEVIEDSKNYIVNLEKDEYMEFWQKIAVKYAHEEDGMIRLSKKDKNSYGQEYVDIINEALTKNKKGKLTLSDETVKTDSGFIMVYGDVEENCTLEAIILNNQELLNDRLNEFLFG